MRQLPSFLFPGDPMRTRIATLMLAVGLAGGAMATPGVGEVGSQAAEFTLQDTRGETHSLSGQRGKVVLLAIVGYG